MAKWPLTKVQKQANGGKAAFPTNSADEQMEKNESTSVSRLIED